MSNKIKLGVSACVMGDKVRYDTGMKPNKFVMQELGAVADFIKVCPEVGMGMSVPRPTIRLISDKERIALVETKDETKDHTDGMLAFSKAKVEELASEQLCGYVVCAKSPTCGMERVKIYGNGHASTDGVGLYTKELMERMPWLPVEEDGRLNDPVLKENFVTRIYCLNDFYETMEGGVTRGKIVEFHSRYKLMLMAHHPTSYKELGRLVANIADYDIEEFFKIYRTGLMQALAHRANRKNNTNVLMHVQGYFKRALNSDERAELAQVITDYRSGLLPILAPLTLLKHYLNSYPDEYLATQRYLQPHPQEMKLRYAL